MELIQRNAKITRFITRLYLILQRSHKEAKVAELIHWHSDGSYFVIPEIKPFLALLRSHFKLTNYNSFVRQLNIYGFRRVPNHTSIAFRNKFFRRKREQDLIKIQRKEEDPTRIIVVKPTPLRVSNERAISRHLFMKRLQKKLQTIDPALLERLSVKKETLKETNWDLQAKSDWLRVQALQLLDK